MPPLGQCWSAGRCQQMTPGAHRDGDHLGSVTGAQLAADPAEVSLHRPGGQCELLGDPLVGPPVGDPLEYLDLPVGQRGDRPGFVVDPGPQSTPLAPARHASIIDPVSAARARAITRGHPAHRRLFTNGCRSAPNATLISASSLGVRPSMTPAPRPPTRPAPPGRSPPAPDRPTATLGWLGMDRRPARSPRATGLPPSSVVPAGPVASRRVCPPRGVVRSLPPPAGSALTPPAVRCDAWSSPGCWGGPGTLPRGFRRVRSPADTECRR